MVELVLTASEGKNSATFLDWDDAALGKAVKKLAQNIRDNRGQDSLICTACATLLACMAAQRNAVKTVIKLEDVTEGQDEFGDWEIVISRCELLCEK